jgi:hypothetical protein
MAFRVVNELKEVTLVYSSNGNAALQLFTDMPGGALAIRLPTSSPASGGITVPTSSSKRVTLTIPFDGIRAKEFYPVITPGNTTQFELYSMVMHLRPIGVYIDGSALNGGEIWSTVPLAPGA